MPENLNDWIGLIVNNTTGYLLPFLIVISVLVFIHELGHYLVARMNGVRVEDFSIGFGKEIWGRNDKHGTRWSIRLIPLGGYVKMFGDTDPASAQHTEQVKDAAGETRAMTAAERKEAFYAKSVGQRAAIVFAGPAINFLFAILVLTGLFMTAGRPVNPPIAAAIVAESAADQGGLQPGDRILSIDGNAMNRFSDIQRQVTISLDRPVPVTVERGGETVSLDAMAPRLDVVTDRFGFSHNRGILGIVSPGSGLPIKNITAINGQPVDPAAPEKTRALLTAQMDQVVTVTMAPQGAEGQPQVLKIKPAATDNPDFATAEALFFSGRNNLEKQVYGPWGAFKEALNETWIVTTGTLEAIGQMITGARGTNELGGLIRIGAIAGDAAQTGMIALISFAAMLSINLGLINLFPVPMLDGGHLTFYAIEAVKGSPVSEKVQNVAFRFGLVLLIGLMLFANLNDVFQLVH